MENIEITRRTLPRDIWDAAEAALNSGKTTTLTIRGQATAVIAPLPVLPAPGQIAGITARVIAPLAPRPERVANVRAFLDEQLARDDMTLSEIADSVTAIATGERGYEPAEDDEDEGSQDGDGFITLDRDWYYVMLGRYAGSPGGNGYPTPEIAAYELAALMAAAGENPDSWICGEHGPSEREFSAEVDKWLNPDCTGTYELPGVRYEPGTGVRDNDGSYWAVRKDYGDLGVMLYVPGDESITGFRQHGQLYPVEDED